MRLMNALWILTAVLTPAALADENDKKMMAGETSFVVRIANIAPKGAIKTSTGTMADVVAAPGLWAVHAAPNALFAEGARDRGLGLETAAEDGDPATLAGALESMKAAKMQGKTDGGMMTGRKVSDDGKPMMMDADLRVGIFNTRREDDARGVIHPGESYEFVITARPGCRFSFVSMFAQSNDCFYGTPAAGIALFDDAGKPFRGDVSAQIQLWDAGTEVNEEPGAGPNQGARQGGHNIGPSENGVVSPVSDGFTYPKVRDTLRVTIEPAAMK